MQARNVPVVAMPTAIAKDRAGVVRAGKPWRPGAYLGAAPTSNVVVAGLANKGTVAARSGGAKSGAGGTFTVLRGTWLELTARPKAGNRFVAWAGACAGQRGPVCMVRAGTANVSVVARFART